MKCRVPYLEALALIHGAATCTAVLHLINEERGLSYLEVLALIHSNATCTAALQQTNQGRNISYLEALALKLGHGLLNCDVVSRDMA